MTLRNLTIFSCLCGLCALTLVMFASTAGAAYYLLQPDGSGDFPTIQAALNATLSGDVIALADGTYLGDGNRDLDFLGKAVTVRSVSGLAENCIIDCQGIAGDPHRVINFQTGEGPATVIRAVTMTHGYSYVGKADPREIGKSRNPSWGGGVLCSAASPTFVACRFVANEANFGGALFCINGSAPEFRFCQFVDNVAQIGAGTLISGSDAAFLGCVWENNQASYAAGGTAQIDYGNSTYDDCRFSGNTAVMQAGGLLCDDQSSLTCTYCTFTGNSAPKGGAAWSCGSATAVFFNCTFTLNSASETGAAAGCGCRGYIEMTRALLAFNDGGPVIEANDDAPAWFFCSDIYGNPGGDWVGFLLTQLEREANFSADPLFCAAASDFTLHIDSPCLPGQHPDGDDCDLVGALPAGCPEGGVTDETAPLPVAAISCQPNPFSRSTLIRLALPAVAPGSSGSQSPVAPRSTSLGIYDTAGRLIRELLPPTAIAGEILIHWDGRDENALAVPSGVYYCHLQNGQNGQNGLTKQINVIR